MKIFITLAISLLISYCSLFAQPSNLIINEFLASNGSSITDEAGEFEDWVEIYNAGNTPVDMGGMHFTDDLSEPTTWQIPTTDPAATTVVPGAYLVFFLDKDLDQGILHVDIKLGASGEAIGLYASDGITEIDAYTFGPQLEDISEGRNPDVGETWAFYTTPTPGATNDTPIVIGVTEMPVVDLVGGFYTGSITLTLTSETPDADLYYTTDGSTPIHGISPKYTDPLQITETTAIRAIAHKTGLEESIVMTQNYLINVDHDFIVVTMTTDPDNLFDPADGLFTNFEVELEKPAHIQFFEPDGTLAFSQNIEIELNGFATLEYPQKSLKMKAKASLGNEFFDYPIFPKQDFERYRSFLMRQSGQDWNRTMFRDGLTQHLMDDVSDLDGVLEQPDLDLQAFRPAILYINGQYWGIQNVREQMTWKYINTHYDIAENDLDVIENKEELKTGDLTEWEAFNDYLEVNTFSSEAMYQDLRSNADIDHYMDYMLHGMIMDNNDWPANNNRHWRQRTEEGKWRWMSKDFDFGFGLRPLNGDWDSGDFTTDMVTVCLAEDSQRYFNRPHSTLLLRRIMENEGAKNQFINRAADLLNTVFTANRVIARIDSLEALYIPEMQQHYDKWQSGHNGHDKRVENLRIFAGGRFSEVRNHFVNYFDEISGQSEVTINANPVGGGAVQFNTLTLREAQFPWEGIYFTGLEVPATAKPAPGYIFANWSGVASGTDPAVMVELTSASQNLTANFTLGSTATDHIVINEINYNSSHTLDPADWAELHNPNNFPVDISGWYFEDESGEYFSLPANTIIAPGAFLILAENATQFSSTYPAAVNVYGDFGQGPDGFGLSGKGEKITLKNALGQLIDEVDFDDKLPWPEAPDGNGPTLQLIAPALDNALPENWAGIDATPGAVNGGGLVLGCPSDIEITVLPGTAGKIMEWTFAPPTSGCQIGTPVLMQTDGPVSGSLFPVGTTTVTYEATDNCGASATCSFDITIIDRSNSISLTCPEDLDLILPVGESSQVVNWDEPAVNSTCGGGTGNANCGTTLPGLTYVGSFEDHEYYVSSDKVTWTDAQAISASYNGSLAVINSEAENDFISENVEVKVYIGLTDENVEGTPEWANGDPVSYTNFTSDPDNDEDNDYTYYQPWNGKWNWYADFIRKYYLLELECEGGSGLELAKIDGPSSGDALVAGTYQITYQAIDVCGGNAACSFNITVANNPQTLLIDCPTDITASEETDNGGANVSWSFATATNDNCTGAINVQQIEGQISGTFFKVGSHFITYEATDDCSNVETCSFTITVLPEVTATEYCESAGNAPWQEQIINVTFADINNNSGKDGYGNFTNLIANVVENSTYPIRILPRFSYRQYNTYYRVWIDLNQDFDFTDAGELVYEVFRPAGPSGTEVAPLVGTINIPVGAVSGNTRMRVSMKRGAYAEPCEEFERGEVEDYTISIIGSQPGESLTGTDHPPLDNGNQAAEERNEQTVILGNAEKLFKVYPNPVKDFLNIDLTAYENEALYLEIYDALGQLILSNELDETAARLRFITVSGMTPGLYLVTVLDSNGQRATRQVIVKPNCTNCPTR